MREYLKFRHGAHRLRSAHGDPKRRRLRVERMEGRLMLSASMEQMPTLEVEYSRDFDGNFFLVSSVQQVAGSFWHFDGGLIVTDSFEVTPRGTTNQLPNGGLDVPIVLNGGEFTQSPWDGLNSPVSESDLGLFSGNGLQPASISNSDAGSRPLSAVYRSTVTAPAAIEEGGSISIPALLAGIRAEHKLAARDVSSGSPVARTTPDSLTPAHERPSTSISGEWARAAVFAMVGSERDTIASPSHSRLRTPANDAASHREEPAARTGGADQGAAVPAAASGAKDAAANVRGAEVSSPQGDRSEVRASTTAPGRPIQTPAWQGDRHVTAGDSQLFGAALLPANSGRNIGSADEKRSSLVVATAHNELGNATMATERGSAVSGLWQRRSLAIPLLLMLAIERVAALNTRPAAKLADPSGKPVGEKPSLRRCRTK